MSLFCYICFCNNPRKRPQTASAAWKAVRSALLNKRHPSMQAKLILLPANAGSLFNWRSAWSPSPPPPRGGALHSFVSTRAAAIPPRHNENDSIHPKVRRGFTFNVHNVHRATATGIEHT